MDSVEKHQGRLELTWTDKDKTLLSTGDGQYDYTFVDPSDYRVSEVRLLHEVDRVKEPAPGDRPEGLPKPTNDNLLITGDAMHVLDALAKIPEYGDKYLGKVKLVYIDPPFNTGRAFNKYEDNIAHSIWLTMLRDRVRQIKPLLDSDGTVWVHLDDSEMHRCRVVLDEELGPENFVGTVIWGKADTSRNDAKQFSTDQDYILVYSKTPGWRPNRLPRSAAQDAIYRSLDGDPRPWLAKPGHAPGAHTHQGMVYAVQSPFTGKHLYPPPGGCWRLGEDRMWATLNEWAPYKRVLLDDAARRSSICDRPITEMPDVEAMVLDIDVSEAADRARQKQEGVLPELYFVKDGSLIQVKGYKPEGLVPRTLWPFNLVGSNRNSKAETKKLFPGVTAFDTPKPERLIQRIIHLSTLPGDIVLDCFAGSGTTAAVAHKMGRRWITSELLPSTVETYTKERLIRVVKGNDGHGVTSVKERVSSEGVSLPQGVQAKDAQDFQKVLRKVLRTETGSGDDQARPDVETDGSEDEDEDEGNRHESLPQPLTVSLDKELAKVLRRAKKRGISPLSHEETKVLNALVQRVAEADLATVDVTKEMGSILLKRTKTIDVKTTLWHGGGGFTHLEVRPSMFEDVDGLVLLADWATQGDLAEAMCAQLEVTYAPDGIFAAKEGFVRYVVVDGLVGESTVWSILDQLPSGEAVEVWATQIAGEAADLLRKECKGSRLEAIPNSVLDRYRRKASNRSPFKKEKASE